MIQSQLLNQIPGLMHGFGDHQNPVPRIFKALWEKSRPRWKQVHGVALAEVTVAGQECGEVDGLWTRTHHQIIAVATADCVPILLARKDGTAVAALHAGWRGTQAQITVQFAKMLLQNGDHPKHWIAAVGPAAGLCCYEVSVELAANFSQYYPGQVQGRFLDLPAINVHQLEQSQISTVEWLRHCTICAKTPTEPASNRFFSYRRDGSQDRQWAVASIS